MRSHKTNAHSSKEKWPRWLKRPILRSLFRPGPRRGKTQTMPAREWLSTKQRLSQQETEKQPAARPDTDALPPLAWSNTGALPPLPQPGTGTLPLLPRPDTDALPQPGQSGPITPWPQTFSPGRPRPGDMFRAYVSRHENYHPRYPQATDRPARIRPISLVPQETPAWLTQEKAADRASLFAVTEEDMQLDMNTKSNDETA